MSRVWEDFREFFDGSREARREARVLAEEIEERAAVKPVREGVQGFVDSGAWNEFRATVLGHGATLLPREGFDASAAYWFRKGLETAINMLDEEIATAEGVKE